MPRPNSDAVDAVRALYSPRCDAVRAALAAEPRPATMTAPWGVRPSFKAQAYVRLGRVLTCATHNAHLARCADCRAYRRGLRRMNHAARRLPMPTPPAFDVTRLPVGLPDPQNSPSERNPGRRRAVIGLATVAAAVALGSVVGPRFATPLLFAAEVRAAVAHANTWHFEGWKMIEGKRVSWEIWGRRTPYFYREQIGDSLLIATNRQRFRLVPPGDHRPRGLALVTPTQPNEPVASLSRGPESFVEGIGGEFLGRLTPVDHNDAFTTLRSPINKTLGTRELDDWGLLTVDTRTRLPIHYELHRAVHGEKTDAQMSQNLTLPVEHSGVEAELTAQYDVALPPGIDDAPTPPGYAVVDLGKTLGKDLAIPSDGTGTAGGLTVHAHVVEADRDGNLHLRFDGWFGGQKANGDLPLEFQVNPSGDSYTPATHQFHASLFDDQGTVYLSLSNPVGLVAPEWYLVPLEPLAADHPRPRRLTAYAFVTGSWYEYLPEARTGVAHDLAMQEIPLSIPLDNAPTALDYDTRPVPRGVEIGRGLRRPLAQRAAEARSRYYQYLMRRGHESAETLKNAANRAVYWEAQAAAEARHVPKGW